MPTLSTVTLFLLAALGLLLLLASCTDSLYALLGSTVGKFLTRNVRFRQSRRYVTGGVYIVLGVTTAVADSEKK